MIKEYQEEIKGIDSKLKKYEKADEKNLNLEENLIKLKERINSFLDLENPNTYQIQEIISRIEVGYRTKEPRRIKICYRYIEALR